MSNHIAYGLKEVFKKAFQSLMSSASTSSFLSSSKRANIHQT